MSMRRQILPACVVLVGIGCGGNVTSPTAEDTGVTSEAAIDSGIALPDSDSAPDSETDAGVASVALEALCPTLADAKCGAEAQACCASIPVKYTSDGCRGYWTRACQRDVDAVNAGKAAYDGTKVAACAAAWRAAYAKCAITYYESQQLLGTCGLMFTGGVTPKGAPCGSRAECSAPVGLAGECSSSGKCSVAGIQTTTGATCDGPWCAASLYCEFASFTCKTASPLGATCSDAEPHACGYGAYCNSGTCIAGKPIGASCSDTFECASWNCDSNKCVADTRVLANSIACGSTK